MDERYWRDLPAQRARMAELVAAGDRCRPAAANDLFDLKPEKRGSHMRMKRLIGFCQRLLEPHGCDRHLARAT